MQPLEKTRDDIRKIMENHGVALGYVFGSYARGKITPLSDIDVAVVFKKNVSKEEYFDRELSITHDIGQLLEIDRVDVVNLETVTSPLLKHRAAIRGICVVDHDHARRAQIEQRVLQEYEDTQYVRKVQHEIMNRQLKNGTFGNPTISPYAYGASWLRRSWGKNDQAAHGH